MKKSLIALLSILLLSCSQEEIKNVGDISFDRKLDDANFKLCNEQTIEQYYVRWSSDIPPGYKGEKRGLEKAILDAYRFPQAAEENGFITIRFIVNCKGESGRFRIEEMDFAYQAKSFDKEITGQLLDIVKSLKGWIPRKSNGVDLDYYQYLTFKMNQGQIIKILP